MVDVAPPGAMLEVRARALHTRLSLADSAPSLTFACEIVRRFFYSEARATSFLGLEPARANKIHKSNAVWSMSPQVWARTTRTAGPHTLTAACTVASPSPAEVHDAVPACQPSTYGFTHVILSATLACAAQVGRLRSASATASLAVRAGLLFSPPPSAPPVRTADPRRPCCVRARTE